MTRRLNVDGDGQGDLAGHGGEHRAVFIYQIASYRYWQNQLGRNDFTYGQFGENFTVEGLADTEVCIGGCGRLLPKRTGATPRRSTLASGGPVICSRAALARW
jgi:MOSC domain-containing protein YiiM